MIITHRQKLKACEFRFYQHQVWEPKVGDFYTIVRDDLKLFEITREENGEFFIRCHEPDPVTELPTVQDYEQGFAVKGFTTEGFGPARVWVPEWIFKL